MGEVVCRGGAAQEKKRQQRLEGKQQQPSAIRPRKCPRPPEASRTKWAPKKHTALGRPGNSSRAPGAIRQARRAGAS